MLLTCALFYIVVGLMVDAAGPLRPGDMITFNAMGLKTLEEATPAIAIRTGLSISAISPRVDDTMLIAVLVQNSDVAVADCTFGGPWVCILAVAYASLVSFYAAYSAESDMSNIPVATTFFPHNEYMPTPGCRIACQLEAKISEGMWTPIGSGIIDRVVHDYHHYRSGKTLGIRVYQGGYDAGANGTTKRTDEHENGGFVGDYYWIAPNEAAYDSFHSTDAEIHGMLYSRFFHPSSRFILLFQLTDRLIVGYAEAANDMVNFMRPRNAIQVCVDFTDSDGVVNEGLFTIGWNGKAFQFPGGQAELDEQLAKCQYGQILHDGEAQEEYNL